MNKQEICIVGIVLLILVGVVASMTLSPYFEMRAFNKFSETKASYWDALFSDLRIIPN